MFTALRNAIFYHSVLSTVPKSATAFTVTAVINVDQNCEVDNKALLISLKLLLRHDSWAKIMTNGSPNL